MRDFSKPSRRPPRGPRFGLGGPARWLVPLLGLWLLYVGVLSEHSLLRLWQLGREQARAERSAAEIQGEIARLERELRDPRAQRARAERALRERSGWAAPGEIIYRVEGDPADSTTH